VCSYSLMLECGTLSAVSDLHGLRTRASSIDLLISRDVYSAVFVI
jgi:hypothetical protein